MFGLSLPGQRATSILTAVAVHMHSPCQLLPCCTTGNGAGVGAELCVWSVMVLSDGTMVSGDSTGTLQFWDGQHGTLLQAFSQHKADILAVAASKDGNTVFATGIDVQVSFSVLAS